MVGVGKPLILYIRCRIHRLEVLANSDKEMIGVMEARRQLDDTDFLSSLVGVRVPLHLP